MCTGRGIKPFIRRHVDTFADMRTRKGQKDMRTREGQKDMRTREGQKDMRTREG